MNRLPSLPSFLSSFSLSFLYFFLHFFLFQTSIEQNTLSSLWLPLLLFFT
jgi:hypothetical protein